MNSQSTRQTEGIQNCRMDTSILFNVMSIIGANIQSRCVVYDLIYISSSNMTLFHYKDI